MRKGLAADRFYKGSFNFRRVKDGPLETVPLYSYESANIKLYDVLVLDGKKYYRTNCGPWATTIDKITRFHADIEQHFSI